ncbi:hypothetical protein [Bacillus sp. FJAT-29814]|uniref:hypothetical protein n=1 Tax=Bacillus sp. FJAT-29814 TaxID=1729688 RepID=UPI000833DE95|nr:hypothetical protein [Bacillus sp. FJAT-29814]
MATMTAQILVGKAHPYDGGMNPEYYMYLSENGVARWTMIEENISHRHLGGGDQRLAQWIPTIEHMLEDALMMIGIYIEKDEILIGLAKQFFNGEVPRMAELFEEASQKRLEMMRVRTREIEFSNKITLSIFNGSTIAKQLPILENYRVDVEVCVPVYLREYNVWSSRQEATGRLDQPSIFEK